MDAQRLPFEERSFGPFEDMQQPPPYVSVKKSKKPTGINEAPLSQEEFAKLARENFRSAHQAYAAEKNKVIKQRRPFALDDEDASTLLKPVSDEVKLSAEEFKQQAQNNYLSAMQAYNGQKDKTITSTGSKDCFSPPDGPTISQYVAEVGSADRMEYSEFMAQAASNRAQAHAVLQEQMGKVRQSSMASPEKMPEEVSPTRMGEGSSQAHHALWRQKRDKRFKETEMGQSEVRT